VLNRVETVYLLHHAQRVLQSAAVENIAGMQRPGFEQPQFHMWQQRGRTAAKLPGQRDVGGGDAADPAENEVLFLTRKLRQFGGELFDLK